VVFMIDDMMIAYIIIYIIQHLYVPCLLSYNYRAVIRRNLNKGLQNRDRRQKDLNISVNFESFYIVYTIIIIV